ncbi:MAG: hypothetical protein P1Q69_13035 [Candidatus Thorarchaeota archaeon]|nr:hypothetical protein [Candidatus Thorarchaeota archaeon]
MGRKKICSAARLSKPIALMGATLFLLILPIFSNLPHVQGFTPNNPVGDRSL